MFFLWVKSWNFKIDSKQFFSKTSNTRDIINRSFSENTFGQCYFSISFLQKKKETIVKMNSNLFFSQIFKENRIDFRQKGDSLVILCPFHNEKTPSFYANEEKGVFYCFGCGVSGNTHTFIKKVENENIKETFSGKTKPSKEFYKFLGNNKKKPFFTKSKNSKLVNFEGISSIQIAWGYYKQFFKNDQKIKILCFLRGFSYMSNQIFGVGFAPAEKNPVFRIFQKKKISYERIIESGLVRMKYSSKIQKLAGKKETIYYFDMFKGRIIIPIFNQKGVVVAFGGRTIDKKRFPKYINSSDWEIFKKKRILFSEDIFTKSIINKPEITILVEGYMDSFTLFQNGIRFSIANLGIGICSYQLFKAGISNKNSHLLFFLDSDFSGKKAVQNFFLKFQNLFYSNLFRLSVSEIPSHIQMKDPDEFSYFKGSFSLTNEVLNKSSPLLLWVEKLVFKEITIGNKPLEIGLDKISKNFHGKSSAWDFFKKFYLDLNIHSEKWKNQVKSFFLKKQNKKEFFVRNQKREDNLNFLKYKSFHENRQFQEQSFSKEYMVSFQQKILFLSLYFCKVRNDISQVCIPNKFFFFTSFNYFTQQILTSYLFEIDSEWESKIFITFSNKKSFFHLKGEIILNLTEKRLGFEGLNNLNGKNEWIDVFLTNTAMNFFQKEKKICLENYKKIIFLKSSLINYPFIYPLTPRKNSQYFITLDFLKKRKKISLTYFLEFLSEIRTKKKF